MYKQFIKNGRIVSLVIALLIVAGLGALSSLPRTEDPKMTNRIASVITYLPGASAERIEALVTEKIEQKLLKLSEIYLITSKSRPGISVIKVQLLDEIKEAAPQWSRVRDLLNDVYPSLPKNTSPPILEDDRGFSFTQIISLNWAADSEPNVAVLTRYAKELQNRLRNVAGTDLVSIFGKGDEEILVEIDQMKAVSIKLTTQQISERIIAADSKVSAGQLTNQYSQMQVEFTGALDSTERVRQVPLTYDGNGSLIRVNDIAFVSRNTLWPPRDIAVVNGKMSVVVGTRMNFDLRIDTWSTWVNKEVALFRNELPSDIELEILFDQMNYTEKRLGDLVTNILIGFAIISLVLLVSLGFRSALIVSLSLPLTVLFTLMAMNFYGVPIHQISVTGLVVALGIMVDNAIVITDSIQQQRQQGRSAIDAVMHSVRHLWLPLLGSTVTTVLAFMPIVLMPGPAGEFIGGIALSVIFSLIGSYIISHTIVAALAGRFIKVSEQNISLSNEKDKTQPWIKNGIELPKLTNLFKRSLSLTLNYPKLTILLVFAIPLAGFISSKQLTEQFFPASDRDMFHIELYLPAQASILKTQKVTEQLTEIIQNKEGVEHIRWFIGSNSPSFYYNLMPSKDGMQNYAQAMVTTDHFSTANRLIPQLQKLLDDAFPTAQILVRKLEQGPPFNAPIEYRIFGPNLDRLKTIGDDIRLIMSQTKDIIHTRTTLQPGTPKVWLQANEDASTMSNLTLTQMAAQLQTTLHGQVNGSIVEATESIPVRVRIGNDYRKDITDLSNLNLLSSNANEHIPLSALTQVKISPSRGAIPHRKAQRVNVIEGYITSGVLPSTVLEQVKANMAIANYQVPNGYKIEIGGESAERDRAVGKLMASVGLIFVLLITVVVLSFNSFRISSIIFLSAFQSVGLGLLSIYVFDYPFGFTVIVGLLGLMGLAINAAIVIVAELKTDSGAIQGDKQAIINKVLSCTRHISSTTITTVGGFLPLILAGGGFWPPFAVAIAGGTVLTTLLSFYFVPTAFLLFSQHKSFEQTNVG